jgi:mRNA interferase MazF
MRAAYVPEAGDIVWLHFDPQAGHEQSGHRPALVVSPALYNGRSGLMVCCPLSRQLKGYPFEVRTRVEGTDCAVLADQVRSLDWRARKARRKAVAEPAVLLEVRAMIKALLQIR